MTAFNQRSHGALHTFRNVAELKIGRDCTASLHLFLNSKIVLLLVVHSLLEVFIVNIVIHERVDEPLWKMDEVMTLTKYGVYTKTSKATERGIKVCNSKTIE